MARPGQPKRGELNLAGNLGDLWLRLTAAGRTDEAKAARDEFAAIAPWLAGIGEPPGA